MNERERIALLERVLGTAVEGIRVGIGDDAAVFDTIPPWVCSVDAAVAGSHFLRRWLGVSLGWDDLGYRATMAAASDLAAMGARPRGVLASLVLPDDVGDAELEALARGQAEAARAIGTSVCGGNLARGSELAIHTTVLGTTPRPLLRSGARSGDALYLAGDVGLAAAGLRALDLPANAALAPALVAFRRPRARIEAGLEAAPFAHAAIDLSDGLACDAARLAEVSGVRVRLDAAALVSEELARAATVLDVDPLELALQGGDDYALLVATPAPLSGFRRVGECLAPGDHPLVLARDGRDEPLVSGGYDHFMLR